ncbi:hypothetical protein Btru_023894 [Bulinus truncatus]|nr:hypothetical protein Btru_023894 [Bulinus truncatus]
MPVGNYINKLSKNKKKDDVHQKVLEIKQRQQNWLKQRDQSQKDEKKITNQLPVSSVDPLIKNETNSKRMMKSNGSDTKGKIQISEKFKQWNDKRNDIDKDDDCTNVNDNLSIRSGAESELERLVSPELNSRLPTQEQDFKNLAEKIANKVKGDLGLSPFDSCSSTSLSTSATIFSSESENGTNSVGRGKISTPEKSSLASHSCSFCKNLMLSSKHVPVMVIPCGHTLCKSCSEKRDTCPSCKCPISSITINIMLQQIIQEYHTPKSKSALKILDSDNKVYNHPQCSSTVQPSISYKTQLSSLQTRYDILRNEYETMINKQRVIMKDVQQQQRQVQNIKMQEAEIEKTIFDLQDRLSLLKSHRNQYENEAEQMMNEKYQLESKITVLNETVSTIVNEMEKLKLLSETE